MKTTKYARRPFYVDVSDPVSEENIQEIAQWCGGTVMEEDNRSYIKVAVHRPMNERQTKAFFGDRVLYTNSGFKVYPPKGFDRAFEKVTTLSPSEARRAGVRPPIENGKLMARPIPPKSALTEAQKPNDSDGEPPQAPVPAEPAPQSDGAAEAVTKIEKESSTPEEIMRRIERDEDVSEQDLERLAKELNSRS